jgi:hypothetical protein
VLAAAVASNCSVKKLSLRNNRAVGDAGAIALALAVSTEACAVVEVDLSQCSLTVASLRPWYVYALVRLCVYALVRLCRLRRTVAKVPTNVTLADDEAVVYGRACGRALGFDCY